MSQLRPLIKNQKLRIDNHARGTDASWGTGLHIHKTFTDGRRGGFQILIPLDKDGAVDIRPSDKTGPNQYGAVRKEIAEALKPGQKRTDFVKDIADAISRFSQGQASEQTCREAASRIANHFGLDKEIISEIVHRYKNVLVKFQSYHQDPKDKSFYSITQDHKRVSISPRKRVPKNK